MFTGFVAIFYLSNCQRWEYILKEQGFQRILLYLQVFLYFLKQRNHFLDIFLNFFKKSVDKYT